MTNVCRDIARAAIVASLPALLLFSACSSGAKPQATPSVSALDSATPAASDNAGGTVASTPTAVASPPPPPPTPAAPAETPAGTPGSPAPTPTPLAATDSTPCKAFQIKGDSTTHNFYLPGQPEYPGLRSNVQCFNTIDDAKGAGFHLPGQG